MSPEEPKGTNLTPSPDWYVADQEGVEQGDILLDFPLVLARSDGTGGYRTEDDTETLSVDIRSASIVVLTQTCDIPKKAQSTLLVAEVHSYDVLTSNGKNNHLKATEYRRALARGTAIQDFLLPPTDDARLSWSIVNFRTIHVVPKDIVLNRADAAASRLRIRSPYKEYLSQAFARFIMRVGLPDTLEEFEKYK